MTTISSETPVNFLVPLMGATVDVTAPTVDGARLEYAFAAIRQHAASLLKAPSAAYASRPLSAPAPMDAPRMR
jgi:hypothetical protein